MTGVDLTADLLGDGAREARRRGLDARFLERDMRELEFDQEFDAVFCMGNSFAYFDDGGNRRFLEAVHRALKPGGRLVLETCFVAESIFNHKFENRWHPFGDLYFLHGSQYDPVMATITSQYKLIRGDVVESKQAVYRVYTYRELMALLAAVGFDAIHVYGSLKKAPFQLGSQDCLILAQRR